MIPKASPRGRIDKSALAIGEPQRMRSPAHLAWIRRQRCVVPGCWRHPCDAHHLTCGPEGKARGLKASDCWALPLCHAQHHMGPDSPHHAGNEARWWARHGVDPIATAEEFWRRSPANRGAA